MFDILFFLFFAAFLAIFVMNAYRGLTEWNRNNHSPRLTVDATVVAKRANTARHHHNKHHTTSTSYYVTFQVDTGDRMELRLAGHEYGLLIEGDRGKLTFQGTRFLGFERI